jgi:metal-sulfur cluster biosynthetic enzyme
MTITRPLIYQHLDTVIDPELGVSIVKLGLIYDVTVSQVQTAKGGKPFIHILMTLTTPGCPLAGVFDQMVKDSLRPISALDVDEQVTVELTFDPPWLPEMMDEETRAELGI